MDTATIAKLERAARRARTIMEREQAQGRIDGSVRQTRRMYLSVTSAQRANSKWHLARMSYMLQGGAR